MLKSGPKSDIPGPQKTGSIPTPPISQSARQRARGQIGRRRTPKPTQSQTLPITLQDLKEIGLSKFYLDKARTNTTSGLTSNTQKMIGLVRAKVQARMGGPRTQERQRAGQGRSARNAQEELGIRDGVMRRHGVPAKHRYAAQTGDLREVDDPEMRKKIMSLRASIIKKDREVAARDGPPPSLGIDGFGELLITRELAQEHGVPRQFGTPMETGNFDGLPQRYHAQVRKLRAAIYAKTLQAVQMRPPLPDGVLPNTTNKLMHVPRTLRDRYGLGGG
jgi:hypothetical protein